MAKYKKITESYMSMKEFIFLIIEKFKNKYYGKIMI